MLRQRRILSEEIVVIQNHPQPTEEEKTEQVFGHELPES